ncbi:MAG: hypothetical protein KatS3mg068_1167 [Candidatus Sericytochromatia bacterium]|nr:MAG: hypothetical protein KatS3mg068_1167 [Candidatus Sericytochromatia bacterium]
MIDLEKNEFANLSKELFQEAIRQKDKDITIKKQKKEEYINRLDKI